MMAVDPGRCGPWAVVTGASSGIGEAFARELASRRFGLILVARRRELLEGLAVELRQNYAVDCRVVVLDLAEPTFIDTLRKTTDTIDVGLVVSNAGTATATEFVGWNTVMLERDVAVNTTKACASLRTPAGRSRARRDPARLVDRGTAAGPVSLELPASKSFVEVLVASLNVELRHRGVTVTVLVAGPTDRPMRTAMGFGRSRLRPMSPRACAAEGLGAMAKRRVTHVPRRQTRFMLALLPRRVITHSLGRMTAQFAQVRH